MIPFPVEVVGAYLLLAASRLPSYLGRGKRQTKAPKGEEPGAGAEAMTAVKSVDARSLWDFPGRESAQRKGRRYLLEGRLVLDEVNAHSVRGRCRGQGHIYSLGWEPEQGWWCECPSHWLCSHLVAAKLVVARRAEG